MAMGTQQQPSPTQSRLSRFGLGFGLKTQVSLSRLRSREPEKPEKEDDWYIPYNGPYEAPPRRTPVRDSWGDVIDGGEDDAVLGDQDLRNRYGGHDEDEWSPAGDGYERKDRPRDRALSDATASSANPDPVRGSIGTARRSTHSNARRPIPSYINIDVLGGVGDSPIPLRRDSPTAITPVHRSSLASFFTFGARKPPSSPSRTTAERATHSPDRPFSSNAANKPRTISPLLRTSHSSEWNQNNNNTPARTRREPATPRGEEDYYNSYYSTLISTPAATHSRPEITDLRQRPPSSPATPRSTPPHPYAYAFPSHALSPEIHSAPPQDADEAGPSNYQNHDARPAESQKGLFIKASISTPNLRSMARHDEARPAKLQLPKGRERWLSAETWCDALLFPRPRFKIRTEDGGSGRIVSPPGSPRLWDDSGLGGREPGLESRVLAHSRSVADLRTQAGPSSPKKREGPRARELVLPPTLVLPSSTAPAAAAPPPRPPRPKSFAQDDLALPSPVPSLAHVLAEGELMQSQRKQWQAQAAGSFQNKLTRSVSRRRTKSVSDRNGKQKEGVASHKALSSIDFLATRTFLGNQVVQPTVVITSPPRSHHSHHSGTKSHSRSHSLAQSKTSGGSHAHSRNESWGKSALKAAKSTTAAFCGLNGDSAVTPVDEGGLDAAMRAEVHVGPASREGAGASPTPSGASYEPVGIALSTPPPGSDHSHYDAEAIQMPDHPYANGGSYTYHKAPAVANHSRGVSLGSDFAGPHPSSAKIVEIASAADLTDVAMRHRFPPQASLHPYAQVSTSPSEERIVKFARKDSLVPPPSKIWAPLAPGVVREVLPSEFQYSPLLPNGDHPLEDSPTDGSRPRSSIYDSVGLAEALAYAARQPEETSAAVSEHRGQRAEYVEQQRQIIRIHDAPSAQRLHREPVQYDASRPPYLQSSAPSSKPASNHTSNHTVASSPLEQRAIPEYPFSVPPVTDAADVTPAEVDRSSQSSSPQLSPQPLNSADDFEQFQDLFYRPSFSRPPSSDAIPKTHSRQASVPWDVGAPSSRRRTGSGLTSLARQLTDEFEELSAQLDALDVHPAGGLQDEQSARNLRFVLAEATGPPSPIPTTSPLRLHEHRGPSAFQLDESFPEDVEESSRASSPIERTSLDDDPTVQMYRVGTVEAVSTPPATSSVHRMSARLSLIEPVLGELDHGLATGSTRITSHSSLQPPSSGGLTRVSYMTNSTVNSRMSGLSDFPVPPAENPHLDALGSYFSARSVHTQEDDNTISPSNHNSRRLTFGGDEDIAELQTALSLHP